MLRDGALIGTIQMMRREARPFTASQIKLLETFADQAVIAIENVRLFTELQARNRDLTATSEILQVISRSPTDTQPVFDTIADNAVRLFRPWSVAVHRFDGELMHVSAVRGGRPGSEQYLHSGRRPTRDVMAGRCIIDRTVIHVPDFETDPTVPMAAREIARARGFRAVINVPMLKDREPIGVISVSRAETGPFSQAEIALLQTFADQAVIAIENVRLFNETKEALEQKTATSEILAVISQSPTDVQPVFDTIVRSAVRLCNGVLGNVLRYDGQVVSMAAEHNLREEGLEALRRLYPGPLISDSLPGRALLTRAVVHVHDVANDTELPAGASLARAGGFRTAISVPMLREGEPIGTINVARREVQPFSPTEIDLLKTFADQAVIAIENVRLFTELQEKNRALTEAHAQVSESLEQQTATSEILSVISGSPTDIQPVLDAVAERAARLCNAFDALIYRLDGDRLRLVAHHGPIPAPGPIGAYTRPLGRGMVSGRVVLDGRTVHVADMRAEADEFPETAAQRIGSRTVLGVPLMREGIAIGAIILRRLEVQPFTDKQTHLVTTFADQAVIAIENVRLFKELEAKNRALTDAHAQVTESLEQQTATAEILRVISQSPTDVQPVFDTIIQSAVRLLDGFSGVITQIVGDQL